MYLRSLSDITRVRKLDKEGENVEYKSTMQTYTVTLPILLGYIVWFLKNQKKDRDANSKGTMLLLRVQLIEYHTKYMKEGSIPSYAYENFNEMYQVYHGLGGNSMVTKMKKKLMNCISSKKENDYGTDHKLCKTGTHRSSYCLIFRRNGTQTGTGSKG